MPSLQELKAKVLASPKQKSELPGPKIVASIEQIIPAARPLDISKPIYIRFLDGVNPHRFWFAEQSDYKRLSKLMHQMQKFYKGNSLNITRKDLKKGLYIAIEYASLWHRGFVVEVFNHLVRVQFVDFGTVEDIEINEKICFLLEEFIETPCIAQRGTLSHIQPKDEKWNSDCIRFFKEKIVSQQIESKIFKFNSRDSSYQMAIKASLEDGGEKILVSGELIKKGWCVFDREFCDKPLVNDGERDFIEYELGKHLKKPVEIKDDNWLPVFEDSSLPITKKNVETEDSWLPKTAQTEVKKNGSRSKSSTSTTSTSVKNIKKSVSKSTVTKEEKSRPTEIAKTATSNLVEPEIAQQTMIRLPIGSVKQIYIHVVHDIDKFCFFLKEEFDEILSFVNKFNDAYNKQNQLPACDNFAVGSNVVIFADENYCRGRIIKSLEEGKPTIRVLLVDYGIVVERPKNEVYKLFNEWKKRQPAVYKGKLANIPEHFHLKSRDQLLQNVRCKFVEVKIQRIENNVASLLLINP